MRAGSPSHVNTSRFKPRDPAPSKWDYRLQRLMLTPGVRTMLRIGLPLGVLALISALWLGNVNNQAWLRQQLVDVKHSVYQRPEFTVHRMVVTGADPQLQLDIATVLDFKYPLSSLRLDLERARKTIEDLFVVESARVSLGQRGILEIHVTPRVPVAVWRENDILRLIDENGVLSGMIDQRSERLDLPLIVGSGAKEQVNEALSLFQVASPQIERVRALVRVGERRWDVVLDRGQTVLLPEEQPVLALDRVMALQQSSDVLGRDIAVVDMRNITRPTLRLNSETVTLGSNMKSVGN